MAARSLRLADDLAVTRNLAIAALSYPNSKMPVDAIAVAKQCMLDWFAVTLAGVHEDCAAILHDELASTGSGPCSVIGRPTRLSAHDAALVNGTASHALDYDDVNKAIAGHPTVVVLPAVLAVAEAEGRSGRDALAAFVAGYEIACILGELVAPSHYAAGFHATATLGAIGSAVAAGLLMGLDETQMEHAIGLGATQSAGLKAMFGSMAKPLHAGKAGANGVLAARLAARGFTAQPGGLEAHQGFISTLSSEPLRAPMIAPPGSHVVNTLFKYHAACYGTHSSIDALSELMASRGLSADDVAAVDVHVPPGHLSVCNISDPVNGLEAKFSLRQTLAMVMCGVDTAALASYTDALSIDPRLVDIRQRVTVHGDMPVGGEVRIALRAVTGEVHEIVHNTGIVDTDIARQGARISAKFKSLAEPVIGSAAAEVLMAGVLDIENCTSVEALLASVR
ncbi:MAG: hypothetical protein APF78_05365 [Sphingomonadales bacterium BRH_c3]|nr:MAG: hypothetical protein APF78_05365 [Sphingomonadales bacterium BRH_c3]